MLGGSQQDDWASGLYLLQTFGGGCSERDLETRVLRGPKGRQVDQGVAAETETANSPPLTPSTPLLRPLPLQPTPLCHLYVSEAAPRLDGASSCLYFPLSCRASELVLSFTLSAVFKVHNMQVDLCTGQRSLQTYWDLARDFYSLHKSVPFHFAPRISLSAPRCP